MTFKTFTTTLLLAASFLLFTACDSKTDTHTTNDQNPASQKETPTGDTGDGIGTDEGANSAGEGGSTSTGGIDDDNTTSGVGNDDNTNTTPTITLTSLTLTIDKTSLNKDENTTLQVEATYVDNSTKDVTGQVAWQPSQADAIKVSRKTLTALQDKTLTLQAKLNGITSNEVKLNITWVVNGHRLPPEPDKKVNDSTLLGIDVNGNGVRDDVERWIYETYKDKHPIHIDIAMQAGRAYKQVLETPDRAKEIRGEVNGALFCGWYYENEAEEFGDPVLVYGRIDTPVKSKYFNIKARKDVYWQYDTLLSGGVYSVPWADEMKAFCDFNTSKYDKE